jgi:segregation and condensation protein A
MITVAFSGDLMQFDGPLDLLLALVRRNQYPLDNLPVAEITRQYLTYIKEARQADVELGADFLETASWLVLLKSRALLSRSADQEPPEVELERALLDHDTLRVTASLLRSRIDAAGMGPGMDRESGAEKSDMAGGTETDVAVRAAPTVQDALTAARRAVAAAKAHTQGAHMVADEGYPVAAILAQLEQRLGALEPGRGVSTEAWFGELPVPEAQVTLLLALLELARLQKVLLAQHERFGAVLLKRLA